MQPFKFIGAPITTGLNLNNLRISSLLIWAIFAYLLMKEFIIVGVVMI